MKYLVILLLAVELFLYSCDESINDIDSIDDNKDLIPLVLGNYWIYDSYEIAQNGDKIQDSKFIDSVIIERKENIDDIMTYYLVHYRNGLSYDTTFIRKHNNKYFILENPDSNIIGMDEKWLSKINMDVDIDDDWNIYNQRILDYEELVDGEVKVGVYVTTSNGRLVSADSIEFQNVKYFSPFYTNKYDSKYEVEYYKKKYIDSNSYKIDTIVYRKLYNYTENFRLLGGIGFSKMSRLPSVFRIFTTPSSTISSTIEYNGWEKLLLRYGRQN